MPAFKVVVTCAYGQKIELLAVDQTEANKIINTLGQSRIDSRFFRHVQGPLTFLINPDSVVSVVAHPLPEVPHAQ